MTASQGMTDPTAWGQALGGLGPVGFLLIPLAFALAVIIVIAIAWIIVGHGIRVELHGLRLDLRLFQQGELLPDLSPPQPPGVLGPLRRLVPAPEPADPLASAARGDGPPSRRARPPQSSRPR
jgi:hypothetical protein